MESGEAPCMLGIMLNLSKQQNKVCWKATSLAYITFYKQVAQIFNAHTFRGQPLCTNMVEAEDKWLRI